MKIVSDYENCPDVAKGSVVALGNFDGVHKGHVAVIEKTKEIALLSGATNSVLTFEPHPLTILKKDIKPFRLTSEAQKISIIEGLGVDNLFLINFTRALSQMKASDFIKEILVNDLQVEHIVTGEDFIFGHNREGNAKLLGAEAEKYGFGYSRVLPVGSSDAAFSSTLIRKCLEAGKLDKAKAMLGRNFVISGKVQKGDQKGRTINFPTINIDMGEYLRPAFGVYAAKLQIEGRSENFGGAVNIGVKPTAGGTKELLEMHIFDFSENIYGHNVSVELIEYIRSEKKFGSLEELSKQIAEDCNIIRKILA
jgi:riboflavin kinase/FMN adenylyltransferase